MDTTDRNEPMDDAPEQEIQLRLRAELERVYRQAPVGLCYLDTDLRYLHVNDWLANVNGVPTEAHIGRTIREVLPDIAAGVERQFRHVIETGNPIIDGHVYAETAAHPGIKKHYLHSYFPVKGEDGSVVGLTCAIRDVTHETQATESLLASEQRYRALLESVPDLLYRFKADGTLVDFFAGGAVNSLPSSAELAGKSIAELFPVEVADAARVLDAAMATGRVQTIDYVIVGEGIRTHFEARVIKSGPHEVLWMARDITDRNKAYELALKLRDELERRVAVEQNEARLNEIVNTTVEAIVSVDEDRLITTFSAGAVKIFGYREHEVLGQPVEMLIPSESRTQHRRHVDNFAIGLSNSRSMAERLEVFGQRKNGERFPAEVSISKFNIEGRLQFTAILRDVTVRRQAEEQQRQLQKLQSLSTLAGGIAHDFNNLLMPILGYAELIIENTETSARNKGYADAILHSTQRARDLVSQILLVGGHGGAGEKELADLSREVSAWAGFLRSTLSPSVSLKENIATKPVTVSCDITQIHQVLVNLGVNASQSIVGAGEISVELKIVELENFVCYAGKVLSGSFARITVGDDGVGMNRGVSEHIFEPFFTTKPVGEGKGLGLSEVYGFLERHDGGIAVHSRPQEGTRFELYLPVVDGQPDEMPDDETPRRSTDGEETILFVDDEESILTLAKTSLEQHGYKVITATDGLQALDIFRANVSYFDLVVTDQTMPRMTGNLLSFELRKLDPTMPIILCTGHSEHAVYETGKPADVDRLLKKPISLGELRLAIREVLAAQGH